MDTGQNVLNADTGECPKADDAPVTSIPSGQSLSENIVDANKPQSDSKLDENLVNSQIVKSEPIEDTVKETPEETQGSLGLNSETLAKTGTGCVESSQSGHLSLPGKETFDFEEKAKVSNLDKTDDCLQTKALNPGTEGVDGGVAKLTLYEIEKGAQDVKSRITIDSTEIKNEITTEERTFVVNREEGDKRDLPMEVDPPPKTDTSGIQGGQIGVGEDRSCVKDCVVQAKDGLTVGVKDSVVTEEGRIQSDDVKVRSEVQLGRVEEGIKVKEEMGSAQVRVDGEQGKKENMEGGTGIVGGSSGGDRGSLEGQMVTIGDTEHADAVTKAKFASEERSIAGQKEVKDEMLPEQQEEEIEDEAWKSDDFNIPPSDNEEELEPPPPMIIELYQKLEKEHTLALEWTCLARRAPEDDVVQMEAEDAVQESLEETADQPMEEDPTEFDFDIDSVVPDKITPRRMPGFEGKGSGSAKKRVAKMDNIINDIRRFSKINEEMEKAGEAVPPIPADLELTPQRPLGKFHIRRDLHQ